MGTSTEDTLAELPANGVFLMPTPGRRAAASARLPTPGSAAIAQDVRTVAVGLNPLVALANSVLALLPSLRATAQHPNLSRLKDQIAHSIREFERHARAQDITAERVMAARYVLCTVLDEAAASTPWGGAGAWMRNGLLMTFHNEAWGGEKVFQLMARLAESAGANRDLLELVYACLALGFQGRYRFVAGGRAQLEAVHDGLAQLLARDSGAPGHALADHWQSGLRKRRGRASWLPAWRENRQLIADLTAHSAAPVVGASAQAQEVRERFEAALQTLRTLRLPLYELPWYVILGAPGSGKTSALLNSGQQFPLADSLGAGAIKGAGSTCNCDWWFTRQAVLLETAEISGEPWQGLLALLKKVRPRRPLDGALLVLSVTDLLRFPAEQRAALVSMLRNRLRTLHALLGTPAPVYVLVTKCDLLAGFTDYFAGPIEAQRAQVWGMTFEHAASLSGNAQQNFSAEFDLLTQRLLDGVIERVHAEHDPQHRVRIYRFPQQFGALRDVLDGCLQALFEGASCAEAPLLRGVYFVSGTQEGTPIDLFDDAYARELQLERVVVPPNPNSGQSFFLTQLLNQVVFAEAGAFCAGAAGEPRSRWRAAAGYAAVGLIFAFVVLAWLLWYRNDRSELSANAPAAPLAVQTDDHAPAAGANANAFTLLKAEVGDFCRQAVDGRYPFTRTSANDVTREDFAALFAPGGRFDRFFQQNLAPLVDMSASTWTFRTSGAATSDPRGALGQFQRAKVIRDTFFRAGSDQPALTLQMKPFKMDSNVQRFNLSVDGQLVSYAHGPQTATSLQWPGPGGGQQARIEFSPAIAGRNSAAVESGPWALFRLLEGMQVETGPTPERFRVTFAVDGRRASYDVTSDSVQNPFRLRELQEFRCPD